LFSQVHEHSSDELNQGNDERSEGKGSSVVHVGIFESETHLGVTFRVGIGVEVVGGSRYHHDETGLGLEESSDPQNSEEHEQEHNSDGFVLGISSDGLSLLNDEGGVRGDISDGVNAKHAS